LSRAETPGIERLQIELRAIERLAIEWYRQAVTVACIHGFKGASLGTGPD
jgi:hypothetical protein